MLIVSGVKTETGNLLVIVRRNGKMIAMSYMDEAGNNLKIIDPSRFGCEYGFAKRWSTFKELPVAAHIVSAIVYEFGEQARTISAEVVDTKPVSTPAVIVTAKPKRMKAKVVPTQKKRTDTGSTKRFTGGYELADNPVLVKLKERLQA